MQIRKRISALEAEQLLAEGELATLLGVIAPASLDTHVHHEFIGLQARVSMLSRYYAQNKITDEERATSLTDIKCELEALLPKLKLEERRGEAERAICAGFDHWANNEFEKALASFNHAGHLFPNDAEVAINQGVIHVRQQEVVEAMACFERAIASRPDDVLARINKGSLWSMQGNEAEARKEWAFALSMLPPDDPYCAVLKDLLGSEGMGV